MTNHSATKLDAIFAQYEKIAEGHHHNVKARKEIIEKLAAKQPQFRDEIAQHQDDLSYFSDSYRATVRKMDLVRQLIALEETHPTSAFL